MLALAAGLLLPASPPSQAAELCTAGVAGIATTCEAAAELTQSLARARVDRTLATDPLSDRFYRLNTEALAARGYRAAVRHDRRRR
jgi:hypothetical protein